MAGSQRAAYEAGRVDERNEIVAWLRGLGRAFGSSAVAGSLADLVERGEHLEAVVVGLAPAVD